MKDPPDRTITTISIFELSVKLVFATNFDFISPESLQPNFGDLGYFKL